MKKRYKILIAVLVILVGFRIYLPFLVTDYVNKVLDDIPGHSGSVEDVDLHLYRGAYQIHQLKIVKTDGEVPVPFVSAEALDISVQWKALFKGSIVGEIELTRPEVNFVAAKQEPGEEEEQYGGDADWTKPIKELVPLQVNRFAVRDGTITFKDFSTDPKVDIGLFNIQLEALNLNNANQAEATLPSSIDLTATSIGEGQLSLQGKANLLKEIPDFDVNLKFEGVNIPDLNDFASSYAKLDFEAGTFNLYTEMAVNDGQLEGYVKPVLTDLKVLDISEDKENPLQLVWEAVAGAVIGLLQNHPKDQFATRVPITGDLNTPNTKIWPALGNIFKNAFIEAFSKDTDNSVEFKDVVGKGK